MHITRRQFFKICSTGVGSTSIALMGFSPNLALAETRSYKLAQATETRNTCPYCSVACGVLIYTQGDTSKNIKADVFHIEGDPDNPVNRGTLCPKGAGLLDMVKSPNRLRYPEVREAGSNEWKRISWDEAISRVAKHMKADRDANFVEKNADGLSVNRWNSFGFLASSASSNEVGYLTHKILRSLGSVAFETQARI